MVSNQVRSSFRLKKSANELSHFTLDKELTEEPCQERSNIARPERTSQPSIRNRQSINVSHQIEFANENSDCKSLQDNYRPAIDTSQAQKPANGQETTQVYFNVLSPEQKLEIDTETISVKSKIKLMESFASSKSKQSERSSSSSSSCSSTKSPPLSPHVRETSYPKPISKPIDINLIGHPQPDRTAKMSVSNSKHALCQQKENEILSKSSASEFGDTPLIDEFKPGQQPLSSLKEKRKTVKELMSKFEPKWDSQMRWMANSFDLWGHLDRTLTFSRWDFTYFSIPDLIWRLRKANADYFCIKYLFC